MIAENGAKTVLLVLIFSNIMLSYQSAIFSLDESSSRVSSDTESFITEVNSSLVSEGVIQVVKSEKFVGDVASRLRFELPLYNGNEANERLNLLLSVKDGKYLSNDNYKLIYNQSNEIIHSSRKYKNDSYGSNDTLYNCLYSISDNLYTVVKINDKILFQKFANYYNITFGLSQKVLYTLEVVDINFRLNNLRNYLDLPNDDIVDFHIVDNFIILIINDNCYIYEILGKSLFDLRFKHVFTFLYPKDIITFAKYNDFLFFSGQEGLFYIRINQGIVNKIYDTPVISMLIHLDVLYGIADKKGLVLFKINYDKLFLGESLDYRIYHHTKMKSLSLVKNPFYGHAYIGIDLIASEEYDEFFIELLVLLNSSKDFMINKIFTKKSNSSGSIIPFHNYDFFYSYFFVPSDNSFYVVRRGLINPVHFVSYKISDQMLSGESTLISSTVVAGEKKILLYNRETKGFTVFRINSFPSHRLDCEFREKGVYVLRVYQLADACQSSINSNVSYPYCQKIIEYSLSILDNKDSVKVTTVIQNIVITSVACLILLLLFTLYRTNCFKNSIKVNQIPDKDNKFRLYEEELSFISTKSNKKRRPTKIKKIKKQLPKSSSASLFLVSEKEKQNKVRSMQKKFAELDKNIFIYSNDSSERKMTSTNSLSQVEKKNSHSTYKRVNSKNSSP